MLLIVLKEHRVKLVNIFILAMDHTILHQVYFQTGVENHKSCLRAFGFIYLDDIFIKHKITAGGQESFLTRKYTVKCEKLGILSEIQRKYNGNPEEINY